MKKSEEDKLQNTTIISKEELNKKSKNKKFLWFFRRKSK